MMDPSNLSPAALADRRKALELAETQGEFAIAQFAHNIIVNATEHDLAGEAFALAAKAVLLKFLNKHH